MAAIHRRWKRARDQRTVSAFHRDSQIADQSMSLAALSLIILSPIDCAVWRFQGPIVWAVLAPHSGAVVVAVVLTVSLTNAVLIHGYLARKTPDERSWPVWLRLSRFVLGGVPVAGFYVITLWRRLREYRPGWTRRAKAPEPAGLETGGSELFLCWQRWTDRLESLWALLWVFLSGLGALLMAVCWMAVRAMESPAAHRALIAVACGLHLLFFAVVLPHFRSTALERRLSRGRSAVLTAFSVLWLIPVPFLPIAAGVLLYFQVSGDNARSDTLIFQALIRRKDAGRLPLWLDLEDRLQRAGGYVPWWQPLARPPGTLNREPDAGRTEQQILRLYDLECYGLGFDAAALSWSLAWLAERGPIWAGPLQAFHRVVLGLSLLGFLAGSCIVGADFLQRVLRTPGRLRLLVRYPWARSLAKGQFAVLCGWLLGWYLRIADIAQLGMLVMLCGGLLLVLKAVTLILRPTLPRGRSRRRFVDDIPVLLILFTVTALAGIGSAGDLLTPALVAWVLTYPLRALLLGLRLVPPLLRPFEWKDLTSPQLPPRLRALLAFLAIPAVLPFGGLAVPARMIMRQRGWNAAKDFWLRIKRDQP